MSRPKLPALSWRQYRIAAALALAALLVTTMLTPRADADAHPAPRHTAPLTPSMTLLGKTFADSHLEVVTALKGQSTAQAAAHQRTLDKAKKAKKARLERQARAEAAAAAARERKAQQRAARSAPRRPAVAPATVSGARAYTRFTMSAGQYQCLTVLVSKESGWNHRAQNASSGAYGLFQALPGSKMSSAGSDWRTNPRTQMRWGLSYIHSRYGTPCGAWNFWQKNRWY
ncbi:transglycosylase SLT domain-containing protein [Streptomyces sp. NPDC058686]|uniref:aggregation-promoting factor C-terminal-like domain-containing protein n=1 Tax=Streptomyces sp. NPDC058686 TaxID=3346599 RepID=UPI00365F5449